jgi:cellulose synthase operon protein C
MRPFTRHSSDSSVGAPHVESTRAMRAGHATLPPPSWTPAPEDRTPARTTTRPLARRMGPRADEGWLRARVAESRTVPNSSATPTACVVLARWLASRDRDLDEAAELAVVALRSTDDVELRRELSAWLESLGEPARAAAALKPIASLPEVESAESACVLARVGLLRARAGARAAAAAAFEAARSLDGVDPGPCELLGTLWAWEPDAVSAATAAEAYLESARRRAALGQDDAQLVDLWRAFAVDPSHAAARALAEVLDRRGRTAAADEVLRGHALALAREDPAAAATVNEERRASASAAHDSVRAFGAALDEGLAALLEGEQSVAFDALLLDLGMLEALVARLDLRRARDGPAEGEGGERGEGADVSAGDLTSPAAEWAHASIHGTGRARAAALERLAASMVTPARAVLLASAVEHHLASGDAAAALRCAELATRADMTNARCVAALADASVAAGRRDRFAVTALERAIGVIGPQAVWCSALADAFDALGETELAAGWSQRCVAQRPGDRDAIERLLERIERAGDGSRLRDALAWLLTQPQPVGWAAEPFARALAELARLQGDHASVVARRALDVFGPRVATLRDAMLAVAKRASDDAFAVAVLERWLSSGAEGSDRRALLMRLAELRVRLGDDEGGARIAARAAHEGLRGPEIDRLLDRTGGVPETSDAHLWRLRANVERLVGAGDDAALAWAWRDLGAALWDLADDRAGTLDAWQRAARVGQRGGGYRAFVVDLVAFAGAAFAFDHLAGLADAEADDATSAEIATAVSDAALRAGQPHLAFAVAARGVARRPTSIEALEAAERAAGPAGEHVGLSALYDLASSRALGRFGRRAIHYRGARHFERGGDYGLAAGQAAEAFDAVPSEGWTFQFLARTAERAGDRALATRTVEQVAEREVTAAGRAGWLLRAASIAGEGEEGTRQKLDLIVRAMAIAPSVATVRSLRRVVGELLHLRPDDRASLEARLAEAARSIGVRLEGPEGARIALAFAAVSFELFGDKDGALESIQRAFDRDADVDEYTQLSRHAFALAQAPSASRRLAEMLARAEDSSAHVGASALRLLAAIASAVGDDLLRAQAWVAAAVRERDDDALVVEADRAVCALIAAEHPSWSELAERLARRVPSTRRAEALVAVARTRLAAGDHSEGLPLLERGAELLEGSARVDVERELRGALDAAGLASEIEARAHRKATGSAGTPAARADSWTELAQLREDRGDTVGAVAAQLEACRLDPQPLERWSALERVAERAGDDEARVAALENIETRIGDDGLAAVLKRLARAHERRSDLPMAERTWRRVLSLEGEDEEADQGIQAVIAARGDYEELVEHLARRAERLARSPDHRELLRAVRLRRAAILEQRLGRTRDACDELELLLAEWPDSVGALRYLADLYDRQSDFTRSVQLWRRAAALEESPAEGGEAERGADRISDAGGAPISTRDDPAQFARRRAKVEAAEALRVEATQALGGEADFGDTPGTIPGAGPLRADLLLESAQASVREGDLSRALARARLASGAAKDKAAPQLLACGLEYRMRGAGAPDEARQTIEELSRIREPLAADDAALRAFLLAEALDVVQGGGAGMRELEATRAVVGDHALVALGLGERLAAQGQYAACRELYRAALAGPLLDLRRPGSVALAGAETSMRAGSAADAEYFLEVAERYEDARFAAGAQRAKLFSLSASVEPGADVRLYDLEAALDGAKTPADRSRARLALAKGRLDLGDVRGAEPLLWDSLGEGLVEAGDVLAPILASSAERTRDLVRVRWQQVSLEPGDVDRLQSLRAAALANDDRVHARAVDHVLRAIDPDAGPLPPPPLAAQPDQPGILAMLARPSMDPAGEALALLWEAAPQLFVRDPASYGITGVERILPGPSSPLARVYDAAMRLLGVPRVPLFVTRSTTGPLDSQVALLSPPSVILAGDVRQETAELRFELGRGIASALPHNVLRSGLPRDDGRAVVEALRTAFGPPELGRQVEARVARLAESFWQIIPASGQRRLQELLRAAPLVDHGELIEAAIQSGRRVGMFLAGDFPCAARAVLAESAQGSDDVLSASNLRAVCANVPALADLLRLAVRPEYADARWHSGASGLQRGGVTSGRYSVF